MHPVRFRTVTGTSRPLTASTTQQRTPLKKDKGEAAERKRKPQWRPSFRSPSGSACQADTSGCHPITTDHNTPCPRHSGVRQKTHNLLGC